MRVKLRGVAVVVLEHSSQTFIALDVADSAPDFITWINDVVVDALMVAFQVVVFLKLFNA
jgi:hypothetical protein